MVPDPLIEGAAGPSGEVGHAGPDLAGRSDSVDQYSSSMSPISLLMVG
ncbi:hypothetical protein [Phytohabitans houttuyneae]|nr:hypothetical protein [Phytohabitans houttuyneae]